MSRTHLLFGISLYLVVVESAAGQSTLIPVTARRDHVFSPDSGILYMSTNGGTIARFNLSTNSLIPLWNVGTSLYGLDVTPDGSAIYVAENQTVGTQGFFKKVNTATGAVTNIPYSLAANETGAWDIKIANNGKGFASTQFAGSGWVPFRELNLATDSLTVRSDVAGFINGQVMQETQINRSADRSLLFMTESNISNGPVFTYDAATNTFPNNSTTGISLSSSLAGVNRNGSLIALEVGSTLSILNPQLNIIHNLGTSLRGGIVFDPKRDILYAANATTNTLIALNTNTWQQVNQWTIGEDIPNSSAMDEGVMSISDNGSWLAMSTPAGVRLFAVPEPTYCGLLGMAFLIMKHRRTQSR